MIHTKVKISLGEAYDEIGHTPIIPISIPESEEIRALAIRLHAKGQPVEEEAWGWRVTYTPETREPIPHSKMKFTPAVFTIGEYPIWFVSFTWEHGKDQAPTILIQDENIVRTESERVEV